LGPRNLPMRIEKRLDRAARQYRITENETSPS